MVRAVAPGLGAGEEELSAKGRLVIPGGVDAHTHIEQKSSMGLMCADDYHSGTVSAVCGGTTTVLSFAVQGRGASPREVVAAYHEAAGPKAVCDYGFHLIVSDPTPQALETEIPQLVDEGVVSFKIYMTYDLVRLDDRQFLDVLAAARRMGALTMVHAENHDMIGWLSERLVGEGHKAPKFHAAGHPKLAESEATGRAIELSELVDAPLYVVHVSSKEAADEIAAARRRGLKVFAETCPQYLLLTAEDLDKPGMEGAKFCCSPAPRDEECQEALWEGIADGTFDVVSSDHAPYSFDDKGKLAAGPEPPFPKICNGVPGVELRMPLLFSEGVGKARISLQRFVAVCCEAPARLFGLYPRKGTIQPGSDADLAIWSRDLEPRPGGGHPLGGSPRPRRVFPLRGPPDQGISGDGAPSRRGRGPGRSAASAAGKRPVHRSGPARCGCSAWPAVVVGGAGPPVRGEGLPEVGPGRPGPRPECLSAAAPEGRRPGPPRPR